MSFSFLRLFDRTAAAAALGLTSCGLVCLPGLLWRIGYGYGYAGLEEKERVDDFLKVDLDDSRRGRLLQA